MLIKTLNVDFKELQELRFEDRYTLIVYKSRYDVGRYVVECYSKEPLNGLRMPQDVRS